jgi:Transposase DDE domain group 1
VVRHGFTTLRLVAEQVASFDYRPGACSRAYRVVVVRQQIDVERGGQKVGEQVRYRFLITNERDWSEAEVVQFANGRCNQENLVAQLKNGVRAVHAPVNTLCANGAYMVIAALAWSLKAWLGLVQQDPQRKETLLRIEFKKFREEFIRIPCEMIKQGRRLVYRLLQYKPWAAWLIDSLDIVRRLHWV